jgi:hypothetical protein
MRAWRLILLAATLTAGGCYKYVPSGLDQVAPKSAIRARLDPAEAARLDDFVTTGTRAVDGEVVSLGPDTLLVLVEVHSELRGTRIQSLNQRVSIARSGILDIETKELDRGRTYSTVIAASLALGVIAADRIFGQGGSSREGPGPPPDEARIPLFSLSLPFRIMGLGR